TRPVFIWIAVIPILFLVGSLWRSARYRQLIRIVEHTRDVQISVQDLLGSLNNAETGRRGYILTGDASYLAKLHDAAAKSSELLQRLAALTQDDPTQQLNSRALGGLVNDRVQLLEQTSQFGGQDAALREERRNGLDVSTELSKVAAAMMAEESRLLDVRKQAMARADIEAVAFVIAGGIATMILLAWAYRILRRYADERDHAEAEVRQANQELQEKVGQLDRLNRELEERVRERTLGLERSNNDLQQFAFVASHDLQEPLRMVSSYLGLLSKSCEGKLDHEAEK